MRLYLFVYVYSNKEIDFEVGNMSKKNREITDDFTSKRILSIDGFK